MTNDKGTQLELSGKQVDLQVNADLSGMAVTVSKARRSVRRRACSWPTTLNTMVGFL